MEKEKKDLYDRIVSLKILSKFSDWLLKKKEVMLYLFFGGLAFLISVGSFALFNKALHIRELTSNLYSWILAVFFAFFTNRTWVFNAKSKTKLEFARQIVSFFAGRIATLAIEELIIFEFVTELQFPSVLVKVVAQVVVIVSNYFISKLIVFKQSDSNDVSTVPSIPDCKDDKRNYGIDFLRMFSMFLVTVLHVLGQGGILSHCDQNGITNWNQYYTAWFFEIAAYGCVDIFGLISGYVGGGSKFKISRFLNVWLQTIFYTLSITILFQIFGSEAIAEETGLLYKALFPIMNTQYWYVTAYFGLFLMMPFLNAGLQKCSKKVLAFVSIASFVFVSLIPTLMKLSLFGMGYGYSAAWLVVMYVIGGTIRKFDCMKKIPTWLCIFVYVFLTFETFHIFRAHPALSFVQYTSPTITLGSIALLIGFANMKFKTKAMKKFISILAPGAFGVYLIHVHPLFWKYLMKDFTQVLGLTSTPSTRTLMILVFLWCLVIFFVGSLIDIFRIEMFQLIRIDRFVKWADTLIDKLPIKEDGEPVKVISCIEEQPTTIENVENIENIEQKDVEISKDEAKSIEIEDEINIIKE